MKKAALWFLVTVALVVASTVAAKETVMKGEYNWTQRGSSDDLRAVFTATGDEQWDVAFHFKFRGRKHTYKGTSTGSLGEGGEMAGTVKTEDKKRTFSFEGSVRNGTMTGTHYEVFRKGKQKTGTLTLSVGGGAQAAVR